MPSGTALVDPTGTTPAREEQSTLLPGQTPEGGYILSVLVKRTYDIRPNATCVRAEVDTKIVAGDDHFGEPVKSTVRYESDFVPYKVATDVAFNGVAYAPGGEPTHQLVASLSVGSRRKDLLVVGDRVCSHRRRSAPLFTDPEPFTALELRYERAYGGVDVYSNPDMQCAYPRNHLGRGFVLENVAKAVEGLALPNLEDPEHPLDPERLCTGDVRNWENQPMPQSFGWFCKYWMPRAKLAGVLPADRPAERELRTLYAQAVPEDQRELYSQTDLPDMDFRFFNGASEGLALPYLVGDEEVSLTNLTPDGSLRFFLPGETPSISIDIGEGAQEPQVALHTVMIHGEEQQVDLVWRAALPYPGPDWLPEMVRYELLIR